VSALEDRTEGWPAGLYLAALSLRSAADRDSFIRGFAGSSRHVVDYLAPEVLGPLDPETRSFLLQTSVLDALSGPLCDAVTGMADSSARLRSLHRDNLFMTALDDEGGWYRYHRLFAEVLRSILVDESPERVPELHRRAADWFADQGGLESTVRHALLAGDHERAASELARDWRQLTALGRFETLQALLDALGPDRGHLTAPLACVEAINAGLRGLDRHVSDDLLALAERTPWQGPTPDGRDDISEAIATVRAQLIGTDLSASLAAARMLIDRKSRSPFAEANGRACLGTALILAGDPRAALDILEDFSSPQLPLTHLYGLGARALATALLGDGANGERAATDALTLARERGLESTMPGGAVALALGVAVALQGRVEEAEPWLEHALRYLGVPAGTLLRAHALLRFAAVSTALGKVERARTLTREASIILSISPDSGALPELLHEVERALDLRSKRRLAAGDAPSEAEMRVLRLLAGTLSRSEIARALFLSPNTVKTHVGAIHRKLGTSTRAETVARARELGLV
jgi:LuxR family maltose regulon positive regulatory protein